MRCHRFAVKRKTDDKSRSLSFFGLEMDAAIVLVHNYRTRDCQSLPGPLADFFRGEEGIEHSRLNMLRNSRTAVLYTDLHPVLTITGLYPDLSFFCAAFCHDVANRVSSIDD